MQYVIELIIIIVFVLKFKSFFLENKENIISLKDEKLKEKQKELNKEIDDQLKELSKPIETLTPEKIEEFWSKKR